MKPTIQTATWSTAFSIFASKKGDFATIDAYCMQHCYGVATVEFTSAAKLFEFEDGSAMLFCRGQAFSVEAHEMVLAV